MQFGFRPMSEEDARAILQWRYEAPYSIYNPDPENLEADIEGFLDPRYAYHSIVTAQGELAGYCCFGLDAQVPGGDYSKDALDVGAGLRPDLTGQGLGPGFLDAILDFAGEKFAPAAFRATVAAFNRRALRTWEKLGFQPVHTFTSRVHPDGLRFVVLLREASFAE
jgi:ribosomal-protein-alanine N-acetyltransferase